MDNKIQNNLIPLRISDDLLKKINKFKGKNRSDKIKRILEAGVNNKVPDNCDYSEITEAIFDLKTEIAPIGANLNQVALFFNQGGDFSHIENFELLDELKIQFKEWMKITKRIQKELNIR